MFYSKSTGGFYDRSIHGDAIPADAVEITAEEHAALFEAQSSGKQIGADADGYPVAVEPPAPTREEMEVAVIAKVQAHLDSTARQYGYYDIKNAVTYADEPAVPKFQQEGQRFRAWRSFVWEATYAELALYQPGESIPTGKQIIEKLPAFAPVVEGGE